MSHPKVIVMARKCTICTHFNREELDQALVSGQSTSEIIARYSTVCTIGRMALQRHKENHLPQTLILSKDAEEVSRSDQLLEKLAKLEQNTLQIGQKAEKGGDWRTALAAIKDQIRIVELQAKIHGVLDERARLTINNNQVIAQREATRIPRFMGEMLAKDSLLREAYRGALKQIYVESPNFQNLDKKEPSN